MGRRQKDQHKRVFKNCDSTCEYGWKEPRFFEDIELFTHVLVTFCLRWKAFVLEVFEVAELRQWLLEGTDRADRAGVQQQQYEEPEAHSRPHGQRHLWWEYFQML